MISISDKILVKWAMTHSHETFKTAMLFLELASRMDISDMEKLAETIILENEEKISNFTNGACPMFLLPSVQQMEEEAGFLMYEQAEEQLAELNEFA